MSLIPVVGFDPSMSNWGVAKGMLNTETLELAIQSLSVCTPVKAKGKQVRVNSKDLDAARQLAELAFAHAAGAAAVFVETPHGSQSARAMASYGICIGVLGGLRAIGHAFFQLSELEVKLGSIGQRTATKKQMIEWAMTHYSDADWPTYKKNGENLISEAKAEHMADAVATIHTGIKSDEFRQTLAMLQNIYN